MSLTNVQRQVLIALQNTPKEERNYKKISEKLGLDRSTVSKISVQLEKMGLLDRSDVRNPVLTEEGLREIHGLSDRAEIIKKHMRYEGVISEEDIRHDSVIIADECSESLINSMERINQHYKAKSFFSGDGTMFSGKELCENIGEGYFVFPYIFFRDTAVNHNIYSMANRAFARNCELMISNGRGAVALRSIVITAKSAITGKPISGRVDKFMYLTPMGFIEAKRREDMRLIPMDYIQFQNMGEDVVSRVLIGTICVKCTCVCSEGDMPESEAYLTILIH